MHTTIPGISGYGSITFKGVIQVQEASKGVALLTYQHGDKMREVRLCEGETLTVEWTVNASTDITVKDALRRIKEELE